MTHDFTEEEREALTILQEEAAELIQAVSKMLRHGPSSRHPDGHNDGLTNEEHACKETAQLILMLSVCHAAGLFDISVGDRRARAWMVDKLASLSLYSGISSDTLDKVAI